jgi:acetate kinase
VVLERRVSPDPHERCVLALNAGSSSLKFALFAGDVRVAMGAIERLGSGRATAWVEQGQTREEKDVGASLQASSPGALLDEVSSLLQGAPPPELVAHRLVRGGPDDDAPTRLDDALLARLREAIPLAPLHLPRAIALLEAARDRWPALPQVVCFDTAFHRRLPPAARRLPIPARFDAEGVRRCGFHGLSFEHSMHSLGPQPPSRVVIAHLGNGASLAAVREGRSIDTTMGFTPSGGIPMGTRPGDLDPGTLLYLARRHALSLDQLDQLINHESGLLAIGGTADMKTLLERSAADPQAALAVEVFCLGVRKAIGAMVAVLGGVDLLVFTGGIGERAAEIRQRVCAHLGFLGVKLDESRNRHPDPLISAPGSPCEVRVVAADEERVMARQALRVA